MKNSGASTESEALRRENERLRSDINYLNKKCEELISGQSDDALIGLLKKKVNDLEQKAEQIENEKENVISGLRKKYNETQKENNMLRMQIKELEMPGNKGMGDHLQRKVDQYEKMLVEREAAVKSLTTDKIELEGKLKLLNNRLRELESQLVQESRNQTMQASEALEAGETVGGIGGRKIIRKRKGDATGQSRPESRSGEVDFKENITPSLIKNMQGVG